jgi:hypothetical protein
VSTDIKISGEGSSTEYEIQGSLEGVTEAVERIKRSYPTPGYGTWFNWPPGQVYACGPNKGQPNTYLAPVDLGNGRWVARGHRSNSCD